MITLKNVSVLVGEKRILDDVSVQIQHGDFAMIVGANGSGKSTLCSLISGVRLPSFGRVMINGDDVTKFGMRQRAGRVAQLFQDPNRGCVLSMTVRENLALAALKNKIPGLGWGIANFPEQWLEQVCEGSGLRVRDFLDIRMDRLSGGQRQCVVLLMGIMGNPSVLVLDEPTSALDPVSTQQLMDFVKNITASLSLTTIMVTHDMMLARQMGNRLLVVDQGKIVREYGTEKRDGSFFG